MSIYDYHFSHGDLVDNSLKCRQPIKIKKTHSGIYAKCFDGIKGILEVRVYDSDLLMTAQNIYWRCFYLSREKRGR
jgi:hypothetical protein